MPQEGLKRWREDSLHCGSCIFWNPVTVQQLALLSQACGPWTMDPDLDPAPTFSPLSAHSHCNLLLLLRLDHVGHARAQSQVTSRAPFHAARQLQLEWLPLSILLAHELHHQGLALVADGSGLGSMHIGSKTLSCHIPQMNKNF